MTTALTQSARAIFAAIVIGATCLTAATAAAQVAAPPSPSIDVVGIRTGMTESEARAALKAAGFPERDTAPGRRTVPNSLSTESQILVLGNFTQTRFLHRIESTRTGPMGGALESVFVWMLPHGNESRVWAISRQERYASGRAPSFNALQSALTGKYGSAVRVRPNGTMDWFWDSAGRPLAPRERRECEGALHNAYLWMDGQQPLLSKAPAFPGIAQDDCAYAVRATVLQDQAGMSLRVEVAALRAGNEASVVTARIFQNLVSGANERSKSEADARRPRL